MARPEVEPGVVLLNLVADFVAPLAAILLPLLAVLDPLRPVRRNVAAPIGAGLGAIGAISCYVGAIFDPPGARKPLTSG